MTRGRRSDDGWREGDRAGNGVSESGEICRDQPIQGLPERAENTVLVLRLSWK